MRPSLDKIVVKNPWEENEKRALEAHTLEGPVLKSFCSGFLMFFALAGIASPREFGFFCAGFVALGGALLLMLNANNQYARECQAKHLNG
jgi:hypothetical protein